MASVSCIYNIGSPENYGGSSLEIKIGQKIKKASKEKLFQQWYIYDSRTDRMYSIDHTFNTLKAASAAYANSIDAYLAVHHKVNQNSDSELMALVAEMDSKLSEGN